MNPNLNHFSRSFVLLSGGIDSATCLAKAVEYHNKEGGSVVAVSMDYGQRHVKEAQCAKQLCDFYGIDHHVLDIKGFAGDCMLTNAATDVPNTSYDLIKGISPTYVPFRNGFMLSRIAAFAQQYVNIVNDDDNGPNGLDNELSGLDNTALDDLCTIYFGAHAEDAKNWAYPDCTPEFIGAMSNAIYIGTYRTVRLLVPFAYSEKSDIIRAGTRLKVPYYLTWSCYKGEELHCGVCPTCRARKKSFAEADVIDPTKYADACHYAEGLAA